MLRTQSSRKCVMYHRTCISMYMHLRITDFTYTILSYTTIHDMLCNGYIVPNFTAYSLTCLPQERTAASMFWCYHIHNSKHANEPTSCRICSLMGSIESGSLLLIICPEPTLHAAAIIMIWIPAA